MKRIMAPTQNNFARLEKPQVFLTFMCLLCVLIVSALAVADERICHAKFLLEPDTNQVFLEENASQPLPPASMVKLMTAYVVLKQMQNGMIDAGDMVTVSAAASKIGGSQVYLKQGEQFTVQELLEAVLVQSANDAAYALAEHIGGSAGGFVEMMRAEAVSLGLKNSEFHTPHGLPPASGQNPDLMSAMDLAILSKALLADFPQVLEYTAISEKSFRQGSFMMRNHNHLVRSYPGCDGLKTGYYAKAGFSVTATAQRNGLRMLVVLMGCQGRKARDEEAARLLSLGFAKYRPLKLIEKGAPAGEFLPIRGGMVKSVMPVATQTVSGMVPVGLEKDLEKRFEFCDPPQAPVRAGTPCGSISFYAGGRKVGQAQLEIAEDVAKLGLWGRALRAAGF